MENGIHKQVDKAENVNSETNLFIKRRPSEMPNHNEHSPISPTRKSLRRDSAWSSEPALTLNIPQVGITQEFPTQNQLRNQYDAFDDGVLLSKIIAGQLGHPEMTVDEKKVLRSKKFQLWRALCYFFTITSFHGLPHIAGSRSCIRICYWMFLICIALGLMVWAIVSISIAYFEFNTYIKTELEEPGQLKFPAVTVCNLNQYRRTYLEKNLDYDETQIFIGALFIDALSSRRILTRDFDFSEINTTFNDLVEMYNDDFGEPDYFEFSHQLENMLVSCYFNNEPCFKDNFTSGFNINGRCFTFNSNASNFLNTTSPGALYGLELVLNVEQYEYFLPDINSVGFKVYLHQQGDFPYLGEHRGFTISPGMHTDVVLSTERLKYLEPPYGVCRKDLELEYFPIYTREACLDECRTKGIIRTCGCRFFYMPGNATICNVNDFASCAAYYLQTFWEQNECDCPLHCNVPESYKYELSYSAYPGRHFPLLLYRAGVLANTPGIPESIRQLNATNNITAQNEIFDFFKENIVKITLYYNQLSLNKLTEVTEYGAFEFIADFGGHLGLFTGAGFLTLFEFVELCLGVFYPKTIDKDHHHAI